MAVDTAAGARIGRPSLGGVVVVVGVAAMLAGGACLLVTTATPSGGRMLVAVYGAVTTVLLCLCVGAAMYTMRTVRRLRSRLAETDRVAVRFADDTLPAMLRRLRAGEGVDSVLAGQPHVDVSDPHRRMLHRLAQAIGDERRARAAVMAACANAAGRVQALATSMLGDLREMETQYDEQVLGDLLKLDHSTAQAGRLADSIAVLTGVRSGRRWTKPIVVESILRGAVGRISAYQRVRVHSTSTAAVAGYAAEGVMHALAELLDNATSFSPPSEEVHVYVEEVQAGVVVAIEDGGLGMRPAMLQRAEKAISDEPLDLTTLSGTRLGLAVVGCLARKHDLKVFFRPSSRGGTGVVVMIPRPLITEARREAISPPPPAAQGSGTGRARQPVASDEAGTAETAWNEPGALPKRRRGQTLAASRSAPRPTSAAPSPVPRSDAPNRFRAFRQAARSSGGGPSNRDAEDTP